MYKAQVAKQQDQTEEELITAVGTLKEQRRIFGAALTLEELVANKAELEMGDSGLNCSSDQDTVDIVQYEERAALGLLKAESLRLRMYNDEEEILTLSRMVEFCQRL